jgi:hypothetical protein
MLRQPFGNIAFIAIDSAVTVWNQPMGLSRATPQHGSSLSKIVIRPHRIVVVA